MKHNFSQKLLKQGIAASKAGLVEDARRLLHQAVELDTDNELAWLWLSGVVESKSERQYCLEQVLRLNPDNTHARAGLAWLAQQATETLLSFATSPVATDTPKQPVSDARPGDSCPFCHAPVSVQSASCHQCNRALVVTCPACEARLEVEASVCGVCGYELGDYRQGAAFFARLGNAYLDNLKADLGITAWQNVMDLDASYPEVYLRLGEAQAIAGHRDQAHASFEQAVRRAANPTTTYLALGRIHERHHQWDEAQQAYEKAVATDESSAAAHWALGKLLVEGKAYQTAFPHIRQATRLDPEDIGAWFVLGQLYELAEEYRKAIQAYERAMQLARGEIGERGIWFKRASERLELLRPSLPASVALNWPETVRQTAGMALIPAVAALVNAGLRPWQIAPADYLGVLLAILGAYLWVSASALPANPGMRAMLGNDGLSGRYLRTTVGMFGGLFWVTGLLYILLAPALTKVLSIG